MKVFSPSRYLNLFIKLIIGGLLLWTLYRQVFSVEELDALWATLRGSFQGVGQWWFWLTVLLVPVNWGLETQKWRLLIRNFAPLGLARAYRAILSGVTISLFTPNRIGEYGGRILMVEARHNWKAVVATLVGSYSQMLILLTLGVLGSWYFTIHFLPEEIALFHWAWALAISLVGGLGYAFFNVRQAALWVGKIQLRPRWRRYLRHLLVLRHYRRRILLQTLGLSLFRFMVYSLQYYALLRFFDIHPPLMAGLAGIFSIFFFQTSLPFPPVLGLMARGEAALFVWGFFSDQSLHILSATFSLFILNLVMPALLGMIFIVQINVTKSLGYESVKKEEQ